MSPRVIVTRLRATWQHRDAGVTLTELVVSMGLFSLVGALTLGLMLSINASSASTVDRSISSSSARNALQAWTGYLRVADGTTAGSHANRIEWLANNDMLFFADLKNRTIENVAVTAAPTMIWLRLDSAGTLVEEQFPSSAALGAAPTVCRALVSNVSTPAVPLFTAYDPSGTTMAPQGTAPPPSAACRPRPQITQPDSITQANLKKVVSVRIDFVVRDTKNAHPLEFKSQAVLPTLWDVS